MSRLSFCEAGPGELEVTQDDLKTTKIDLALAVAQDNTKGYFIIKFKATYRIKEDVKIIEIESESVFEILNHEQVLNTDAHGDYLLPQDIVNKFAAIAVGGTRGMLAIMISNPIYRPLVLPPIDVDKMLSEENEQKL